MLVNALGHLAMAARLRGYNPGVVTAAIVFVPLSLATLAVTRASVAAHVTAIGLALGLHAGIVMLVLRRAAASGGVPAVRA